MRVLLSRGFTLLSLGVLSIHFQNCSGAIDQADLESNGSVQKAAVSDFTVIGGRITDKAGKAIRFKNDIEIEFRLTNLSVVGQEVRVKAINETSGRMATVALSLNSQGSFNGSIRSMNHPYMCFDETKGSCDMVTIPAGYPSAGTLASNCSSPIRYDGSVSGGVNGLSANLSCTGTIAGITKGYVAAGVPMSCDHFTPDKIEAMPVDVIEWMAEIFPSGITRHMHWTLARQLGYNGDLGTGGHAAYTTADPARQAAFDKAVSDYANTPVAGVGTLKDNFANARASGYKGVFLCGGHNCWVAGNCDAYGRLK